MIDDRKRAVEELVRAAAEPPPLSPALRKLVFEAVIEARKLRTLRRRILCAACLLLAVTALWTCSLSAPDRVGGIFSSATVGKRGAALDSETDGTADMDPTLAVELVSHRVDEWNLVEEELRTREEQEQALRRAFRSERIFIFN